MTEQTFKRLFLFGSGDGSFSAALRIPGQAALLQVKKTGGQPPAYSLLLPGAIDETFPSIDALLAFPLPTGEPLLSLLPDARILSLEGGDGESRISLFQK